MCHLYTFYHVCGHLYARTEVRCMPTIESRIEQVLSETEQRQVCSDETEEIKINPLYCENCLRLEEMNEWLQRAPVDRFSLLRDWQDGTSTCTKTERPLTPRPKSLHETSRANQSSPGLTDSESVESPKLRAVTPSISPMTTIYENGHLDATLSEPTKTESHATQVDEPDTDKPY